MPVLSVNSRLLATQEVSNVLKLCINCFICFLSTNYLPTVTKSLRVATQQPNIVEPKMRKKKLLETRAEELNAHKRSFNRITMLRSLRRNSATIIMMFLYQLPQVSDGCFEEFKILIQAIPSEFLFPYLKNWTCERTETKNKQKMNPLFVRIIRSLPHSLFWFRKSCRKSPDTSYETV